MNCVNADDLIQPDRRTPADDRQETATEEPRHLWDGSPWPNHVVTPEKNTEGQRP